MIFLYDLYVWVWAADIKIALRSCMQQGCLGSAVFDIGIRFGPGAMLAPHRETWPTKWYKMYNKLHQNILQTVAALEGHCYMVHS